MMSYMYSQKRLLNEYWFLVMLVSRLYLLGWIGTDLHVILNYNYCGRNVFVITFSYFPWTQMWKYVILISKNKQSNMYYNLHHSLCINTLTYTMYHVRIMGLNCWHTLFKSTSDVLDPFKLCCRQDLHPIVIIVKENSNVPTILNDSGRNKEKSQHYKNWI